MLTRWPLSHCFVLLGLVACDPAELPKEPTAWPEYGQLTRFPGAVRITEYRAVVRVDGPGDVDGDGLADLDRDGRGDLIPGSENIELLPRPVGDVNGDGRGEVARFRPRPNDSEGCLPSVSELLSCDAMRCDTGFGTIPGYVLNDRPIDLDGDARPDLMLALHSPYHVPTCDGAKNFAIAFGREDGTFDIVRELGELEPRTAGDLDGDGLSDIVLVDPTDPDRANISWIRGSTERNLDPVALFEHDQTLHNCRYCGIGLRVIDDADGDGRDDLALVYRSLSEETAECWQENFEGWLVALEALRAGDLAASWTGCDPIGEGTVELRYGPPVSGWEAAGSLRARLLGFDVTNVGDVDGNGLGDFTVVAQPTDDPERFDTDAAYLVLGATRR